MLRKNSLVAEILCCNGNKHTVFTKTSVTAGISFYLLHETSSISDCFSVCQSANCNQSVCVISVSSQYPHVCQPVCLSFSLSLCQPAFTGFTDGLSEPFSAILPKDDLRELFYTDVYLNGRPRCRQHKQSCAVKIKKKQQVRFATKRRVMWNTLASHHHWCGWNRFFRSKVCSAFVCRFSVVWSKERHTSVLREACLCIYSSAWLALL